MVAEEVKALSDGISQVKKIIDHYGDSDGLAVPTSSICQMQSLMLLTMAYVADVLMCNITSAQEISDQVDSNCFVDVAVVSANFSIIAGPHLSKLNLLEKTASIFRPKLIIVGASAYPRDIDYPRFRKIEGSIGAFLMMDMAHISGLVAASVLADPFEFCDIVTTTTHNLQGGPHNNTIGGLTVCLKYAQSQDFKNYQNQVVADCRALANRLVERGYKFVSGGSDNHLVLVDLRPSGIDDARAGARQREVTINGIGERGGNASLEEVVMALKYGGHIFNNLHTGINTRHIYMTSKMVEKYSVLQLQPHKALVGANAFAHESGIHQDGMLKHKGTYEIISPEDIGFERTKSLDANLKTTKLRVCFGVSKL
ncbi:hypothetical protein KIW84_011375 [Lathyrus oleraceus]|uniref:Glycine hydroxymethyltransferase n=1 Tax=Pisum sativum TaxID=3888 RepID=A0A9D5BES0_PEA|nr:hypothetical protein KIW84_011375 [Pisum sativum]